MTVAPLGSLPLATLPVADQKGVILPYASELQAGTAHLFMLALVRSYDAASGEVVSRFSTHGFVSDNDDSDPAQVYQGRLQGTLRVDRSIPTDVDGGYYGGIVLAADVRAAIDQRR